MADLVSAVKKFFEAETFVDIVSTISTVRETCGIQAYGRPLYDGVKAGTSHQHQCASLWDILDKRITSCPTYAAQVRLTDTHPRATSNLQSTRNLRAALYLTCLATLSKPTSSQGRVSLLHLPFGVCTLAPERGPLRGIV
jgi:hypothetical protein